MGDCMNFDIFMVFLRVFAPLRFNSFF